MNILIKIIAHLNSIPARLKGMKFGKNSFIGLGYDWFNVNMKRIVIKNRVTIGSNAWIQTINDGKIFVGNNSQIGRHVTISSAKKISIGQNCLISYNVSILDHDHRFVKNISPIESKISKPKQIIIDDNCFIGAHSFILKGVHLGKHCVVGANSVVTKSFPAYSVIAGNPARLIKKLKNK